MEKISFASDNCSSVHKRIMGAIESVNAGSSEAYGNDAHTVYAKEVIKREFDNDPDVYFVYNGTAANVISIMGCIKPFEAVVTTDISHIETDEAGAPEGISRSKVLTVEHKDGKIDLAAAKGFLEYKGSVHHVQPKLISIAQTTEIGTVYSKKEIDRIVRFAHENDMYIHVDGARIANACAASGIDLNGMIADTGVDILSLGVSKNGGMFGDAIVVFNEMIKKDFIYYIKHALNLHSKNRYIAAQFIEFFKDGLFYSNAKKANEKMMEMSEYLKELKIRFLVEPDANAAFVYLDKRVYTQLSRKYYFHNISNDLYRLMTSYDTTSECIQKFYNDLKRLL